MTIPKVKPSSIDSVGDAYDREGVPYIKAMMDEIATKQPIIVAQIALLLRHLDDKMENGNVDENLHSYILENIGYRMFAMIKSLYIQEEVNNLEEGTYTYAGRKNEQN